MDACIAATRAAKRTPTPTPAFDGAGRRIYKVNSGSGFIIVAEGFPGLSGVEPGRSTTPVPPNGRPDIQIESNRPIGLGTELVCDIDPVDGGMPAVSNPSFPNFAADDQFVTNELNDFGCRFGAFSPQVPCTKKDASNEYVMISSNPPSNAAQFCYQVPFGVGFPPGDTLLAVRFRTSSATLATWCRLWSARRDPDRIPRCRAVREIALVGLEKVCRRRQELVSREQALWCMGSPVLRWRIGVGASAAGSLWRF